MKNFLSSIFSEPIVFYPICIVFLATIVILYQKKKNTKVETSVADINDFITYICNSAEISKVPKNEAAIKLFILNNLETLKFRFVFTSRKILTYNVSEVIEKSIKQYLK